MNAHETTDCIVIGGGLLGMLTARLLRREGHTVRLLERGETGRESSWAGGGILSPLRPWKYPDAVSDLVAWSQQHYPHLAAELKNETGIDIEWIQSGLMMVGEAFDDEVKDWTAKYDSHLLQFTPAQTTREEPALASELGASLYLPDVAQVRNPRLCKALRKALQLQGVSIEEQTEVTEIQHRGGEVSGVATSQGEFAAGRVVVAGGAWSAGLVGQTGLELPVEPVRGQMILFMARPGVLRHIVFCAGHYLIPRKDGHILAGSTLEHAGFDKTVTEAAHAELRQAALELVPALSSYAVVKHWSGLRPGSPRGVPFIGEHPEISGLYVNTGHFRNGVAMGPASARLLADLMLGQESITDPAPYRLARH